jgi:hypothetical protein
MAIDFPERIVRACEPRAMVAGAQQRSFWRAKLAEAERRYAEDRSASNRAEYMRILRIFKDLVLYDRARQE